MMDLVSKGLGMRHLVCVIGLMLVAMLPNTGAAVELPSHADDGTRTFYHDGTHADLQEAYTNPPDGALIRWVRFTVVIGNVDWVYVVGRPLGCANGSHTFGLYLFYVDPPDEIYGPEAGPYFSTQTPAYVQLLINGNINGEGDQYLAGLLPLLDISWPGYDPVTEQVDDDRFCSLPWSGWIDGDDVDDDLYPDENPVPPGSQGGAGPNSGNGETPGALPDCPTCPGDKRAEQAKPEQTEGQSVIDNIAKTHIHFAYDYLPGVGVAGCTDCGVRSVFQSGKLNLSIERIHRYADADKPSSFGPGVFLHIDHRLFLYESAGVIEYWDPRRREPYLCTTKAGETGVFEQPSKAAVNWMKLYSDLAGTQPAATMADAKLVKVAYQGSYRVTFEIIDLDPADSDAREGRLVSLEDRSGRGLDVSYAFAADASDTTLSDDRSQLRKMSSLTGRRGDTAQFTYGQFDGRWFVTGIALPNSESLSYQYATGGSGLDGLIGVTFPDSTASQFSASKDPAEPYLALSVDDAGSLNYHRRKTLLLTPAEHRRTPDARAHPQPSGRVRAVIDGEGDYSYRSYFASGDEGGQPVDYIYVQTTGSELKRLVLDQQGNLLRAEWAVDRPDPELFHDITWQVFQENEYDSLRRPTKRTDPRGKSMEFTYSKSRSQRVHELQVVKNLQPILYKLSPPVADPDLDVSERDVDPDGRVTLYTYDSTFPELVASVTTGSLWDEVGETVITTGNEETTSFTYDAAGNLTTITAPDGQVTTHVYDANNRRTETLTPPAVLGGEQGRMVYAYDSYGRLQTQTTYTGTSSTLTVTYAYDSRNRPTTVTYHDGSTETYTYGTGQDANLLIGSKDRGGNTWTYGYDLIGRRTSAVLKNADNSTVRSESYTYVPGTTTRYASVTVDGSTQTYGYDAYGRLISSTLTPTDGQSLTTSYGYDVDTRLLSETGPYGHRTFYRYDDIGRATRIIQEVVPGAIADGTDLDALTRSTSADPDYVIVDTDLSPAGLLLERIDARGIASTRSYDDHGRLASEVSASGQLATDTNSPVVPITDPTIAMRREMVYDAVGRLVTLREPRHFDPAETGPFETSYSYGPGGALVGLTLADGRTEATTETYDYDRAGRPIQRTDAAGNDWDTIYHSCCGRVQAQLMPATDYGDGKGLQRHTLISNNDYLGRVTHQIQVGHVADTGTYDWHDPTDADTLREVTTAFDALGRPTAQTVWLVARGNVDPNDVPITTDPAQGLTTTWTYDTDLTDSLGIDASFDASGLGFGPGATGSAVLVTRPDGTELCTMLDGIGRVVRQIDALGIATDTSYDALVDDGSGRQLIETAITDDDGFVVRSRVNGLGQVEQTVDALGKISHVSYLPGGLVDSQRDPTAVGSDSVYDAAGRLQTVTSTGGGVTSMAYGIAAAGPTSITDPDSAVLSMSYDGLGRVTTQTLPNSNVITTIYDALGRVTSRSDSVGSLGSQTYYPNGLLASSTDPTSATTDFVYDGLGRSIETTDALSHSTSRSFDLAGRLATVTDALSKTTIFSYDEMGRLITTEHPGGVQRHQTWTDRGQPHVSTDEETGTTTRTYDDLGRLSTVTDALSRVTSYAYDGRGLLTSITRPDLQQITYTYDDAGRRLSEVVPAAGTTSWTYDDDGRRDSLTDARNNTTDYGFSPAGRLLTETNALNKTTTYGYNALGLVTSLQRKDGASLSFAYDDRGRLTTKTIPAHGGAPGRTLTYTYDLADRQLTATDGSTSSISTTYDALGQATAVDQTYLGSLIALSYTYDAAGRRASMTDPAGTTTYGYDDRGRLTSLSAPNAGSWTLAYDDVGRLTSRTAPNGVVSTATYDLAGQLTKLEHVHSSIVLAKSAYTYSTLGQRLSEADWQSNSRSFTYDLAQRLLTATAGGGWSSLESFTYDLVGNLTGNSQAHDAFNRLLSDASWTYSHNDEGELQTRTKIGDPTTYRNYQYDAEGRLLQVQRSDSGTVTTTDYVYDAAGRRIAQTVGGTTTRYVYDGLNPTLEYQGTLTQHNVFAGMDRLLSRYDVAGTATSFAHDDGLGSITALTDGTAAVTERYRYSAYGQPTVMDAAGTPLAQAPAQPFGYTGREWDDAAELVYLRNRYYDPEIGRFIRIDPARAGENWYAYTDGDPISRTDPLGLEWVLFVEGYNPGDLVDVQHLYGNIWRGWRPEAGQTNPPGNAKEWNEAFINQQVTIVDALNNESIGNQISIYRTRETGNGVDEDGFPLHLVSSSGLVAIEKAKFVHFNNVYYKVPPAMVVGGVVQLPPNARPECILDEAGPWDYVNLEMDNLAKLDLGLTGNLLLSTLGDSTAINHVDLGMAGGLVEWLRHTEDGNALAIKLGVGSAGLATAVWLSVVAARKAKLPGKQAVGFALDWLRAQAGSVADKAKGFSDELLGTPQLSTAGGPNMHVPSGGPDGPDAFRMVPDSCSAGGGSSGNRHIDLTDARGRRHILDGDGPRSGGHRHGTGTPGKSEFPADWSDGKILETISDIASDPNVRWSRPDSRGYITGSRNVDGVDVFVVFDTVNDRIVTGYPTNLPRNP